MWESSWFHVYVLVHTQKKHELLFLRSEETHVCCNSDPKNSLLNQINPLLESTFFYIYKKKKKNQLFNSITHLDCKKSTFVNRSDLWLFFWRNNLFFSTIVHVVIKKKKKIYRTTLSTNFFTIKIDTKMTLSLFNTDS